MLFPSPYTKNIIKVFKKNPNYPLFKKPYGPIATYLWSYALSYVSSGGDVKSFDVKVAALMHDFVFGHIKRIKDPKALRFIEELGKLLIKKYSNSTAPYVIDSETIFEVKRRLRLKSESKVERKKKKLIEKIKSIIMTP